MKTFPPIHDEHRPCVGTAQASHYLDVAESTMRDWSCQGTGPIKPRKFGRKLLWPMAEIRKLLGVEAAQ